MQQTQIGGGLLGRRGVEIGGRQGVEVLGEPRLVLLRAEPLADRRAALAQQVVDGGFGAFAGEVLHGAMVEIGDDFQSSSRPTRPAPRPPSRPPSARRAFAATPASRPARQTARPTARRPYRGGTPGGSSACACGPGISGPRPRGREVPAAAAASAAIFSPTSRWSSRCPLPRSWINSARCSRCFWAKRAVDAPQRPRVRPKLRGELHRPQTMLVHRVLVVLIELQQAPGVMELGNESLQEAGVVQIAQQRPEPGRMAQQREEMAAGLRRRQGLRQPAGVAPNRLPTSRPRSACRRDSPGPPAA